MYTSHVVVVNNIILWPSQPIINYTTQINKNLINAKYFLNAKLPTYMPSTHKLNHVLTLINNLKKKHIMFSTKRTKMPLAV